MRAYSEDLYEEIDSNGINKWSHNKKNARKDEDASNNDYLKAKMLLSVTGILVAAQAALAAAVVASVYSETASVTRGCQQLNSEVERTSTLELKMKTMLEQLNNRSEPTSTGSNATIRPRAISNKRLAQLDDDITSLRATISHEVSPSIMKRKTFIFNSCSDVLALSLPSGYYLVKSSSLGVVSVYCDMSLTCGGRRGGWTKAISETFPNLVNGCPSGFVFAHFYNNTFCARSQQAPGCSVINHSLYGISYSSVCGRVTGAQLRTTDGFIRYKNYLRLGGTTIPLNSTYLDGISLTHGGFEHHIWSLVALQQESTEDCSCNTNKPSFVGPNYSCDEHKASSLILWDGLGCSSSHNKEWFYRNLSYSTSDDLEVRVCRDEERINEDVFIKTLDIYIQ